MKKIARRWLERLGALAAQWTAEVRWFGAHFDRQSELRMLVMTCYIPAVTMTAGIIVVCIVGAAMDVAQDPASPVMVPWALGIVGSLVVCALAAMTASLLVVAPAIRGFAGASAGEVFTGVWASCLRLLGEASALSGKVAALVVLVSPITFALASMSEVRPRGDLSQVKQVGSVQLGLAVFLVSIACVCWSGECLWRQLQDRGVPPWSRAGLSTFVPAAAAAWAAGLSEEVMHYAASTWVPSNVAGLSREQIVDHLVGQDLSVLPMTGLIPLLCILVGWHLQRTLGAFTMLSSLRSTAPDRVGSQPLKPVEVRPGIVRWV